jgi:hypothetical protein
MSWECRAEFLSLIRFLGLILAKLPSGLRCVGAARPPAGTLWAPRHTVKRVPESYSRELVIKTQLAHTFVRAGQSMVSTLLLVPIGSGRDAHGA